jgi:hypothetical protein
MATILDKDLTRETSVKFDNREVVITLTDKQTIYMKLKGMKSGGLEIGIDELYRQLKGDDGVSSVISEEDEEVKVNPMDLSGYKGESKYLISLHEIRHAFNITPFEYDIKVRIDEFFINLINERLRGKK